MDRLAPATHVALEPEGEAVEGGGNRVEAHRSVGATPVGVVGQHGLAADARGLTHGWRLHEDHTTDGVGPVPGSCGTPDHADLTGREGVDLGGVVGSPFLALVANAVVEDEEAALLLATDDGLGGVGEAATQGDPGEPAPWSRRGRRRHSARGWLRRGWCGRGCPCDPGSSACTTMVSMGSLERSSSGGGGAKWKNTRTVVGAGAPSWMAGTNPSVNPASIAALRKTSGPDTKRTSVTWPASSTSTRTVTSPCWLVARASSGYVERGLPDESSGDVCGPGLLGDGRGWLAGTGQGGPWGPADTEPDGVPGSHHHPSSLGHCQTGCAIGNTSRWQTKLDRWLLQLGCYY